MRWQLMLQTAAGLALLFLLAHFATGRYVAPPAEATIHRTALAEAGAAASETVIEWQRMHSVQERLVKAAVEGPILSSLGGSFPSGEGRQRALKAALDALVAESGNEGQALLLNARGAVLAGSGQGAPQLSHSNAIHDALDGAASVRLEIIDGTLRVIAAAPITASGEVTAALALSNVIDSARLTAWTGRLPTGGSIVLLSGKTVVASTLRAKKAMDAISPDPTGVVEVDGEKYGVQSRDLIDDNGAVVKVLGMAKRDQAAITAIDQRAEFMVIALGSFAIMLVLVMVMLAPAGAAAQERSTGARLEDEILEEPVPFTPAGTSDDLGMGFDAFQAPPPPRTPSPRAPAPFTSISQPASVPKLSFKPAERPPTGPPLPPPALASRPMAVAMSETQPAIQRPSLTHPPTPAPVPASPFDAIAAAAMSSPPPPVAAPLSLQQAPPIDSNEDLPMPVEHLQLPGLRAGEAQPMSEPGRTPGKSAPALVRSTRTTPPGTPARKIPTPAPIGSQPKWPPPVDEDPWRAAAPAVPGMRHQQVSKSDDLPLRPSAPPGPPPSPARAYGGSAPMQPAHSQASMASGSRDPLVAFDEEHYRLVYNEFVGSKARLGEVVDNITYEGFSSKLRSSEKELIDRHGCRAVRFQVLVKDRQVSLRPQLVR